MRDWVASLEEVVDNKLKKWLKFPKHENGDAVQLRWQFEQTHFHMDIFWEDHKELIVLQYVSPRVDHAFRWHGLNDATFNKIVDRVGNLAVAAMYPMKDPEDQVG